MIYENVIKYCEDKGLSISGFEQKCSLANGTVSKWENAKEEPKLRTLRKIESATGILMQKWLE